MPIWIGIWATIPCFAWMSEWVIPLEIIYDHERSTFLLKLSTYHVVWILLHLFHGSFCQRPLLSIREIILQEVSTRKCTCYMNSYWCLMTSQFSTTKTGKAQNVSLMDCVFVLSVSNCKLGISINFLCLSQPEHLLGII